MTAETATAETQGYGNKARALHWLTAALMAGLVGSGLYAAWIGDGPARTGLLENWHKPVGITVLVITLWRLVEKQRAPVPLDTGHLRRWEMVAARAGHGLLYALLLALPLSGLLMAQGAGRPTPFFHLFYIPQILPLQAGIPPRAQFYYRLGKSLHEGVLQWGLYVVFALHLGGVLKHRFLDGDRAFLRRMWGRQHKVYR